VPWCGEVVHTWTERVQVIRSESAAAKPSGGPGCRLKQTEAALRGVTPPVGPGRVSSPPAGVGAGRQRAAAEQGRRPVDGDLGRDETVPSTNVGPGRSGPKRRKTTQRSVRYQITSVTRDTRRIERLWRGWLASAGDQHGVVAPVACGLCAGLPRGDVRGACVPPVEGPAAGIRPLFVHRDDQVRRG